MHFAPQLELYVLHVTIVALFQLVSHLLEVADSHFILDVARCVHDTTGIHFLVMLELSNELDGHFKLGVRLNIRPDLTLDLPYFLNFLLLPSWRRLLLLHFLWFHRKLLFEALCNSVFHVILHALIQSGLGSFLVRNLLS